MQVVSVKISYTLRPVQQEAVWNGVLEKESMWAFPDEASIRTNLVKMYEQYPQYKKRAKTLQKWIREEFTEEKKYEEFLSFLNEYTVDKEEENQQIEDLFSVISAGA